MTRILLSSGTLIDGSGAAPVAGDVLMEDDLIAAVGRFDPPAECRVIDCRGLTVAPGFIDIHSHSDVQVLEDRREKADQGVTTEVVGNCGFSAYPSGQSRERVEEYGNGIFNAGAGWGKPDAARYLEDARRRSKLIHVASLVGHGSLRVAFAGHRQGTLERTELQAMERALAEALDAGACGLSTGLMYAPGSSAPREELERLCRVVARAGKIYTTHMRSYSWHLLESIDEQLELARQTGCRLQISHLQAVGRSNWEKQAQALEKIVKARSEGIDVAFDIYPYVAGSTVLTQLLPQWALDGGIPALLERLASKMQRDRIAVETESQLAQRWSDVFVSAVATAANQPLVGKQIAEIAAARGAEPAETVMDLLVEEKGAVNIVSFNQSEDNLRRLLSHPLCIVISDGFYVKGRPHPRLYGTFPQLLGQVCREKKWLSLAEAIHKVTALPARRFQMKSRGLLAPTYYADVTVFDAGRVVDRATYQAPERAPDGIRWVFREGRLTSGHELASL